MGSRRTSTDTEEDWEKGFVENLRGERGRSKHWHGFTQETGYVTTSDYIGVNDIVSSCSSFENISVYLIKLIYRQVLEDGCPQSASTSPPSHLSSLALPPHTRTHTHTRTHAHAQTSTYTVLHKHNCWSL